MKKKTIICGMLVIMMVAVCAIIITSCNKDSSKDSNSSGSNSNIVGSWKGYDDGEELTLIFNNDGTGRSIYKYENIYSSGYYVENDDFRYTMSSSTSGYVIVKEYDSYYNEYYDYYYPLEISGNTMTIYEDDYYGMYVRWVLTKQ